MSLPPQPPLKVALIGCGRLRNTAGATGFGMAHHHLAGYVATGRCVLAAVADTDATNAAAFVAHHQSAAQIFSDYREMAATVRPEVVSICLWPHLHAEAVAVLAPLRPRLIFCEKPMDVHWDASLRMHALCREHGVRLAINHQRRFNRPLIRAKALLDDGAIGPLRRMEGAWHNLADAGTHVLDLMFFFNHETPAEWVLGQLDLRGSIRWFGVVQPGHGISTFRFQNGVRGIYHFGQQHAELGCLLRLIGDHGSIEIMHDTPWLRVRRSGQTAWEDLDTGENIHDFQAVGRGIADVFAHLDSGGVPQLASENALRATELIFATHESARRRGRVDLPLAPGPCALQAMIAAGEMSVDLPPT